MIGNPIEIKFSPASKKKAIIEALKKLGFTMKGNGSVNDSGIGKLWGELPADKMDEARKIEGIISIELHNETTD